jgi:hypothetical protein
MNYTPAIISVIVTKVALFNFYQTSDYLHLIFVVAFAGLSGTLIYIQANKLNQN